LDNLLLTLDEITKATKGRWENFKEDIKINEFHITFHYLKPNDIFVVKSDNWINRKAYKNTEHFIKAALDKNISAIMVREGIPIDTNIPILRVENTYFALKSLARYALKKTLAKKVLITGSYGKTAFKLHLHQIIKRQINSYTRFNSANYTANNYCAMASIKTGNELYISEIPVAKKEKIQRRGKFISPDIAVLTSIGHEHIERFKSIENIIENKLSLATHMKKDSKLLVNKDTKYFELIKQELKKYSHIDIRTYGQSSSNNAFILFKRFREFGWDLIAKIEDQIVSYRVPFFEEHTISNSLGVLLCAYHLGANLHEAANEYCEVKNFKSSGLFYKVNFKNKNFYLYDQSNRGGIEGYEGFFKTQSYIKPKNGAKKILVSSEFVDYKDGEMELIDTKYFQTLIEKANFDILYTVEKFDKHKEVLKDTSIWKKHSTDFNHIKDEIIQNIKEDDIVCVKGIFESNLPKFIEYIKSLEGIKVERLPISHRMKRRNESLKGLRTIKPSDIKKFKEYTSTENKKAWVYYFPFIYFWSLSSSREILIEDKKDYMNLFLLNRFHRDEAPKISLYLPTLPLLKKPQEDAINRIFKYKGYDRATIIWIDEQDVSRLKEQIKQIKFSYKTFDYLYDAKMYDDLSGGRFKSLRKELNRMSKNEGITVVDYEKKHKNSCLDILNRWMETQANKYNSVSDEKYTRYCIMYNELFDKKDLNGFVILQDQKVVSFGFYGEMTPSLVNFFVGKSDYSLNGIQSYMKYTLFMKNKNFPLANDGPGISKGLDHSKKTFNPIGKHKLYKAQINSRKI
jgi:UDP-N-acetylmuramoyl-tripeptide--D-alanyl-D-alanine ligase